MPEEVDIVDMYSPTTLLLSPENCIQALCAPLTRNTSMCAIAPENWNRKNRIHAAAFDFQVITQEGQNSMRIHDCAVVHTQNVLTIVVRDRMGKHHKFLGSM